MPKTQEYLERIRQSLDMQTFRDFEWIITEDGKMAENTNSAIKKAKGDIIKILFLDDYLENPKALQHIADSFTGGWLVSGCLHDVDGQKVQAHFPTYSPQVLEGVNTIGSPSVLAFENKDPELFDESLSWVLDCDLYYRLYSRYGPPTIVNWLDVVIGVHEAQTTHILPNEVKLQEQQYLLQKYA
jgi:hypothetical protein